MTATLANNPFATTVGNGLFADATTYGLVQGTAYPDPAVRFQLRRGWLSNNETLPMWGGCAIYEDVPGVTGIGPIQALGVQVGRATSISSTLAIAGFSVFDQAYNMVNNPQSPVPLAGTYMTVMSYRLGSGARIAVACDPTLVDLYGDKINQVSTVSWDFVNQLLIPYEGTLTISSGTYNNTTGVITLTMSAPITFGVGPACVISGFSGTGAYLSLIGTWTAIAGTAGSTVVLQGPVGVGASTITTGGSLVLGSGSDVALNVTVLEIQASNCMTVNYNAALNTAAWNYNGSCAVIQI